MRTLLADPIKALLAGLVLAAVVLLLWLGIAGADRIGLVSFLLRWLHVATSIVWLGLIWFVNFIQLAALGDATEAERAGLQRLIVPQVAKTFRYSSHLVVASGIVLLVTSGYLLDRLMFTSAVYIPPLRNWLLWGGTLAGTVMWALVHLKISPALKIVLGDAAPEAKAAARDTVRTFARVNLILAVPVTFVMVAAAHLY